MPEDVLQEIGLGGGEHLILDQVEPLVEMLEDREESVHEAVEHLVQEPRTAWKEGEVALEPHPERVERRRVIAAHRDEEVLRVEAVHLH